jgi:glycosyltransferase involved in cell wall biosynthesis
MSQKDGREKISIVMANYNNGKYISEAIKSVMRQTSDRWELLIIDDKSTDNSIDIIQPYFKDARIKLLVNEKNIGYIATLKKLIDFADNDLIGILDSDDVLLEKAAEKILETYDENKSAGFVYTNCQICDENLSPMKIGCSRSMTETISEIFCPTVDHFKTFRKGAYLKTKGYDEEILYAEDRDLVLKLEETTKFVFLNEILYKYRKVPGSQTTDFKKGNIGKASYALAKYKAFIRRQNSAFPNLTKKQMSDELYLVLPSCIKIRDWARLKNIFILAFKIYPLNISAILYFFYRLIKLPFYRLVRFFYPNIEKIYD